MLKGRPPKLSVLLRTRLSTQVPLTDIEFRDFDLLVRAEENEAVRAYAHTQNGRTIGMIRRAVKKRILGKDTSNTKTVSNPIAAQRLRELKEKEKI